jgi:hypothetical protein
VGVSQHTIHKLGNESAFAMALGGLLLYQGLVSPSILITGVWTLKAYLASLGRVAELQD